MPAKKIFSLSSIILAGAFLLAACASTDYLPVRYQLPGSAADLGGKQVVLEIIDARPQATIFGPSMQSNFRHFTGNFALRVARDDSNGIMMGAYDLRGLFREALAQRLKQAGVAVVTAQTPEAARMTVTLTRFALRQDSVKWYADIAYQAELGRLETLKASQSISGTEERLRMPGSKNVETVLGDIFTTMINRLDLDKLFSAARV